MKETSKAPKKVKEKPAEALQEITTPSIASTSEETTTRYPDADLEEFRILIEEKIAKARLELQFLQGQLRGVDEKGEDNAERHLSIEDGSATMELEQTGRLAARQIQFINNLENALLRIRNKTYGICRQTGKLIDKARLRAVPHATLSMEAKTKKK